MTKDQISLVNILISAIESAYNNGAYSLAEGHKAYAAILELNSTIKERHENKGQADSKTDQSQRPGSVDITLRLLDSSTVRYTGSSDSVYQNLTGDPVLKSFFSDYLQTQEVTDDAIEQSAADANQKKSDDRLNYLPDTVNMAVYVSAGIDPYPIGGSIRSQPCGLKDCLICPSTI